MKNIYELGASDLLMCASTAISLPLHLLYKNSNGLLKWNRGGMVVQSLYQLGWLVFWCGLPFVSANSKNISISQATDPPF